MRVRAGGGLTASWSDDESFWMAMEPALCAPARLALAATDVTNILSLVRVPRGSRILDLACGPGAHAIEFASRGYVVTGVDRSSNLIRRAREAAAVEWIEGDMRTFRQPSTFDLVCSLYASFGYFDDATNRAVLDNIRASLKPRGVLVLDVIGRESLARNWRECASIDVDGTVFVQQRHIADARSILVEQWTVVTNRTRRTFRAQQRLYAGTELRDLLLSVGFSTVELFGSFDATAYDENAKRLIAVARSM